MEVKSPQLVTKIYFLMVLPLIYGIFVVGVSYWSDKEIQVAENYRVWTNEILKQSMDLSGVGFDVISYPEEKRPRRQWEIISKKLALSTGRQHYLDSYGQDALVKIISSQNKLNDLYIEITKSGHVLNERKLLARIQRATKRLLFEINVIVYEANELNNHALKIKSKIYPKANYLITLIGIVSLFLFLVIMIMLKKSVLTPLLVLKNWSHKLAGGELDNRIILHRKDEIGSLADDFNKMADKLQTTIRDMEAEVRERKQVEKLLRTAQVSLSDANENLELRIKERTKELAKAVSVAQDANKSKSLFLANISHELRTPMHGILGFSRLGKDRVESVSSEKLKSYFEIITTSGDRLLLLLNDLLDLAKLESGKLLLHPELCNLSQMVEVIVTEQAVKKQEKHLRFSIEIEDAAELLICDHAKINQVIVNLLANALKFSEEDTAISICAVVDSLEVKTDVGLIEQEAIKLSISDEGIGIPDNELEQVFDKFIQSSKTDSGAGGTGLGLAICKEIVELHQGKIYAESNENGATFVVVLPKGKWEK